MELCSGGAGNDLYQSTGKSLPEPVIAYIIRETTKALAYCHESAIMHRDIKAANILFTDQGDVKLTDFGVSCQMASPQEKRKTYIGTPYWVAPEIIMVNCLFKPYVTFLISLDNYRCSVICNVCFIESWQTFQTFFVVILDFCPSDTFLFFCPPHFIIFPLPVPLFSSSVSV